MTRIALTSDWHGNLPDVPECDVLVVAGDICPDYLRPARKSQGWRQIKGEPDQARWLRQKFIPHIAAQPAKQTVIIAGNHDHVFESTFLIPYGAFWEANITYLCDESHEVNDIVFHGTPWVPNLPSWAFHGTDEVLAQMYGQVPDETDVLITHGPPRMYGDETSMRFASDPPDFDGHVGSQACLDAIQRVEPRVTVCGHIHEGAGHYRVPVNSAPERHAHLYNVAYVDERYVPTTQPIIIDL
jgi:Icc-related predicted phosphoesterase